MGRVCILLLLTPAFFLALYPKAKKNPDRVVEKNRETGKSSFAVFSLFSKGRRDGGRFT